MRAGAAALLGGFLLAWPAHAQGFGGRFGGDRGGGQRGAREVAPPNLPYYPYPPNGRGNAEHTWMHWWSYNQHAYVDYRRRQRQRKGAISGKGGAAVDPDAWREDLRRRLVPVLKEALADPEREVRAAAALALGKVRALDAVPALQRLYERDDERYVSAAALRALMLMRDPTLAEYFIALASRRAEPLLDRGVALIALGNIGNTVSREFLLGVVEPRTPRMKAVLPTGKGERRQIRLSALAGLLLTGHEENAALFLRLARSKRLDEDVRGFACNCLGKMEARSAYVDLLRLARRAPDAQVRRSAVVAIGAIAPREDTNALAVLVPALTRDKDKVVRHFAAIALGHVGGDEAFRRLRRFSGRATREERGFALLGIGLSRHPEAAAVLERAMDGAAEAFQACPAVLGFALLDDPRHAPLIRRRFETTTDFQLKEACLVTLGVLDDKGAAPAIEKLIRERERPELLFGAVRSYALIRQHKAVPLLLESFRKEANAYMLRAFVQSMAFLSSERAAEPLLRIQADEGLARDVRAYALRALGTLADRSDYPLLVRLAFHTNYFVRCGPLDAIVGEF